MSTFRGRYINETEAHFFDSIYKELQEQYVGTVVYYYKHLPSKIDENDLYAKHYKENVNKVYDKPCTIPADILNQTPKQEQTLEGARLETKTDITISFRREYLKEVNIMPQIGDVFGYQRLYFEIINVDDTPTIQGSPEYKYTIECQAIQKRFNESDLPMTPDWDL